MYRKAWDILLSLADLGMLWYGVTGVSFNPADPAEVMLNTGTTAPLLSDHPRPLVPTPVPYTEPSTTQHTQMVGIIFVDCICALLPYLCFHAYYLRYLYIHISSRHLFYTLLFCPSFHYRFTHICFITHYTYIFSLLTTKSSLSTWVKTSKLSRLFALCLTCTLSV